MWAPAFAAEWNIWFYRALVNLLDLVWFIVGVEKLYYTYVCNRRRLARCGVRGMLVKCVTAHGIHLVA